VSGYLLIAAGANAHVGLHPHALRHALGHRAVSHKRRAKKPAHIHLPILSHIRIHGPALDYVGLFLLAILSGVGINGFGEAALIAAGVYVANHHIPVAPVVLIAAAGGFVGGVAGFVIGNHGGRSFLTAAGPLARVRKRALARSEEVYLHYDVLAILLTPAWAAGIHRVGWPKLLWLNLASALLWAGSLGLGAYYLGTRVTTAFSNEIGWVTGGVAAVLIVYYVIRRALRAPSRPPS
jgi:membrane protein DedA with SNARE-associated domain